MARNEIVERENVPENSIPGIDAELMSSMEEEVLRAKRENIPMIRAFEAVAQKSGLKVNTIRNYYYRYLHAHLNKNRGQSGVKRSDWAYKGVAGKSFTEEEVRNLVMAILAAQAEGESVRACANRLAGGDPKKMLRLQNKYRNVIASQSEYVRNLMDEMAQKGIRYFNPYTRTIVEGNEGTAGKGAVSKSAHETVGPMRKSNAYMAKGVTGSLAEVLGKIVTGLGEFDSISIDAFFSGLQELVYMAGRGKRADNLDQGTRLEKTCEDFQNRLNRMEAYLDRLIGINQRFLALPDVEKISSLNDYLNDLGNCIKEYANL
ncbi:MAG: hypothetical protein GX094_05165 [Clostridiales bacterium]|jgi:hypothetical protein|nr:hypothetical protein [Clostridiales bacterium]